jgi:nucleoside-diphosphate-sugar epimerase
MMKNGDHVLVTGGAGYLGSLFVAELLRLGYLVTVVDSLLYGGDALLSFLSHPNFHFFRADICEPGAIRLGIRKDWQRPSSVFHLAALVGFPACQSVGRELAFRYNVEGMQRVYEQAENLGVSRFVFASTYSIYANDPHKKLVTEASPLEPHSLYSETKINAEEWLQKQSLNGLSAVTVLRQATAYGLSPRMRFDLLVNQFVLDAFIRRELVVYQRGFSRSFIHINDVIQAYLLVLQAPVEKVRNQVYNMGGDLGNYSKDDIVNVVLGSFPEVIVRYKDHSVGGDLRNLRVSFEKIRCELGFEAQKTVEEGVNEVAGALRSRLIRNPYDRRHHNAETLIP